MPTIAFVTLGCKVNQADTEALTGAFASRGYELVSPDEAADVYVINTCTVTNLADRKSRQMIRQASRRNPQALIVVTGCLAQTDMRELTRDIPQIGIISGTQTRGALVEAVEHELAYGSDQTVCLSSDSWMFEEFHSSPITERTRATLKVQEGCESFCSYCKIPYARGPIRSRPFSAVLSELHRLADEGFAEVVLSGVHLGHYGKDWGYSHSITDVVRAAADTEGLTRIRLSSIDPMDVSDELISLVAHHRAVCRHLHIPLQGGEDLTLVRMNRGYTTGDYEALVNKLRAECPEVAISSDVITGFPGETEENFRASLQFVTKMGFSRLHVFPFSPRAGTPAAAMPGQVSPQARHARAKELARLGLDSSRKYNCRLVGSACNVLIESGDGGLTDTYVRVKVDSSESFPPSNLESHVGSLLSVRVTGCSSDCVRGHIEREARVEASKDNR